MIQEAQVCAGILILFSGGKYIRVAIKTGGGKLRGNNFAINRKNIAVADDCNFGGIAQGSNQLSNTG